MLNYIFCAIPPVPVTFSLAPYETACLSIRSAVGKFRLPELESVAKMQNVED